MTAFETEAMLYSIIKGPLRDAQKPGPIGTFRARSRQRGPRNAYRMLGFRSNAKVSPEGGWNYNARSPGTICKKRKTTHDQTNSSPPVNPDRRQTQANPQDEIRNGASRRPSKDRGFVGRSASSRREATGPLFTGTNQGRDAAVAEVGSYMSIARQFPATESLTSQVVNLVVNTKPVVNRPAPELKARQTDTVSKRQPGSRRSSPEALRTYHRLDMRKRRALKADGPHLVKLMSDAEVDAEIERQRVAETGLK